MNARNITAKIALTVIGAAVAASALAGTASASVSEGTYTAKAFPLGPVVGLPPLTAGADVTGDTLTIAGVPATITPTAEGGVATIAGVHIVLTQVPGENSYVLSTPDGVTLGQIER